MRDSKSPNHVARDEQAFVNAVIENASALVIILDQEGRITRFNRACEKITGCKEADVIGDYVWDRFLTDEEADLVRIYAFNALASHPERLTGTYTNNWIGKNNQLHLIEWSNSIITDEKGNMEYMISVGVDVSDRKKIENALRNSEARLKHAQRLADIGSWELDHTTGKLTWSEETFRIFETLPDLFSGKYEDFLQFVHPEDKQRVDYCYKDSIDNHTPYDITHRIITQTGKARWVHERGETFYINEIPVKTVGAVQDITEQREAHDALSRTNQILNAVFDNTHIMTAYLDTSFNFVKVNKAYAAADKKKPDDFTGKNHFEMYPDESNQKIFQSVIDSGVTYQATAKPFEYEYNPDRGTTHWDWTLTPIKDVSGDVTGLVLSLLDVTQRIVFMESLKKSENELRQLNENLEFRVRDRTSELSDILEMNELMLHASQAGITVYNEQGDCIYANDSIGQILGASKEQVLAQNYHNISSWQKSGMVELANQVLKSGTSDSIELNTTSSFGKKIWLNCLMSRFTQRGRPHLFFMAVDISAQKLAEKQLLIEKDRAEQANMAKSDFLSRMSHELRTPMNAIMGFSQLLEMGDLKSEQVDYVKEIKEASRHLLHLITELLDLSRIESGRLEVHLEPVDITNAVQKTLQMVQPLIDKNHLKVNNLCVEQTMVFADVTRLNQILINLLSNAAKYTGNNGSITLTCLPYGNKQVRLSVIDNGPGIPENMLDRLFQPFERLGAEHSKIEGTGIGLALSKKLAELMGCELGVNSSAKNGSEFWLILQLESSKNNSAAV